MSPRYLAFIALLVAAIFVMAACGDEDPTATQPVPTTSTPSEVTPAATPEESPSAGTSPTAEASPGGGSPTAGDPEAGQALAVANGCTGCHSTGSDTIVGPGLAGVAERAATRIPGMSADEYLHQSIVDSQAFIVPGFPPSMPPSFPDLSEEDVNDIIAFLKTLE